MNFHHGRVLFVRSARSILPLLIWPLLAAGAAAPAAVDAAWLSLTNNRPEDVLRKLHRDSDSRAEQLAWAAGRIGSGIGPR